MWTRRTAFCLWVSLLLTVVSVASRPASLPLPGVGRSLGRSSRQAVSVARAYHDSHDGACRLPLAAGFSVKSHVVQGGAFYDAVANHIFRRPDEELEDFCHGTRRIAVVQQLRGAVYPREAIKPESALARVASDYLTHEVLEDGSYFAAMPDEVSNLNGIPCVRTTLTNESGQSKHVDYSVEYVEEKDSAVVMLTVKERQAEALRTYHGFVARCSGDKILAGCARFLLEDNLAEADAQAILGAIAGIQVKEPAPNPVLEKAVVGTWDISRPMGAASGTDARYIFGPDGRFARMLYIHGDLLSRGPSEPGDYRIYGNLISLRYDKDELVSFPVRVEGNVLNLGDQTYSKVTR